VLANVVLHRLDRVWQQRYHRLNGLLQRINSYLVRWAKRRYKRLGTFKKARKWWEGLTARQPRLFAHWKWRLKSVG